MSHGIQSFRGSIPIISTKKSWILLEFTTFSLFSAQKVVVVMFKNHSRLSFRPLVFHLKIKYSRGGISWLVSQWETPKSQLSLKFLKFTFQQSQPEVFMESKFSSVQLGIRLTNSHRQGSERSPKGGSTVGGWSKASVPQRTREQTLMRLRFDVNDKRWKNVLSIQSSRVRSESGSFELA